MKNTSIEHFYKRISGHIFLLSDFLEDKFYNFLIKACRLKPYSLLFEKFSFKTHLVNHWVDEYGNSLYIDGKATNIRLNDSKIDNSKLICTDMFYGFYPKNISINSNLTFILIDQNSDSFIISFLGNDRFLRTFKFVNGEWEKISALSLGLKALKLIYIHQNENKFITLDKSDFDCIFPFVSYVGYISKWLPSQDLLNKLNNNYINKLGIFDVQR